MRTSYRSEFTAVFQKDVDDSKLLECARTGDARAFRLIIERYAPGVSSTVVRMLGDSVDAKAIAHDAFLRFYNVLDTLNNDINIPGYLHRIAINLSLNELKRRKKWYQRFTSLDAAYHFPSAPIDNITTTETQEQQQAIKQAMLKLPDKLRAVAVLRLVQEFSTKETAAMLDIPVGTVMSRLSRAQSKLRKTLAPYIEE